MKGHFNVDQLRVGVENLTGYEKMSYYERWLLSIIKILIDNKVITRNELENKLGVNKSLYDSQNSQAQQFKVGDVIKVKNEKSNIPFRKPHLRTPGYIYGVEGIVIRVNGKFGNPELLAYTEEGPEQFLYSVRFRLKDLWAEYDGNMNDTIEIDIFQHWIIPGQNDGLKDILDQFETVNIPKNIYKDEHTEKYGHSHLERKIIEQNAVIKEGTPDVGEQICEALGQLLVEKQIFSNEELQKSINNIENMGQKQEGARIVARAWMNPDFKQKLLEDANQAIDTEFNDISGSNPNTPTKLVIVESTYDIHNLVVCTLCSCYPRGILGMSPSWYKSRAYRSRSVREPRKVLEEFGVDLDNNIQIRVLDSTADLRYMVLPKRPEYTKDWSEEKLIQLITRDSMIGTQIL